MMIGAGVSRWTMLHLGSAVIALLLAGILLATGYADLIDGFSAPATLIMVHLVTIGWLSLMMLGALYQFVPVITNTHLYSQRLPILAYGAIVLGLLAMIAGFVALGGQAVALLALLPVGGGLVVIGFALGAYNIAATLWRSKPLALPARFVAAGLGFLLITALVGLGFTLAFGLSHPPQWLSDLVGRGLTVHVLGGLGGWVTLTAMGVSYRLLSMFMLAPDEPRLSSHIALYLTAGGLLVFVVAGLFGTVQPTLSPLFTWLGAAAALIGAAVYLFDIQRLYRTRARRQLELNSITAAVALIFFAVFLVAAAVAAAFGQLENYAPALGYLFVFGWLSGLGLSQLYKIVPFMTWLEVFGKKLGKGPVPRVQDLVNERRAAPWFVIYFLAVLGVVAALLSENTLVMTLASSAQFLATLAIAVELWISHRPDPNAAPKPIAPGAFKPFVTPATPSKQPKHGG